MLRSAHIVRVWPLAGAFAALALAALVLPGCPEEIDMSRPEVERGTLGQEIYFQLERDLARTAVRSTEKAAAIRGLAPDLIWAIDALVPESEIEPLNQLTQRLLPIVDNDELPDLVRKLAFLYDDLLAQPDVLAAWARADRLRVGLAHESAESELIARIMQFPRLRELTEFTVDLILDHDGIGPSGQPDPAENDFVARLLASARDQLLDPGDPTDIHRNVAVVAELALAPDVRFAIDAAVRPMWGVRPDARGLPMVALADSGSALPGIFADTDGDRLPDIDFEGAFLDRSGSSFYVAPYDRPFETQYLPSATLGRDELGRAFFDDGAFVYDYIDLNETGLGYVLRRTPELIERSILNDTFIGLEGLLGELDRSGEYPHFGTNNAVLDVMDAVFQVGEFAGLPALLEGVSTLLGPHEQRVANLIVALDAVGEISDRLGAELEPDNGMIDDLLPYFYELSQHKGLLDDILTALQDPMTNRLMVSLSDLLWFSTPAIRPAVDGSYNSSVRGCFGRYDVGSPERFECLRGGDLSEILAGTVDNSLSELDGNVSLMQRLSHLIYDGSRVPFDMAIVEMDFLGIDLTDLATDVGSLMTIPDVTAAFFDSIAGNFCLEDYINVERIEANGLLSTLLDLADAFGISGGDTAETITSMVVFLSDELGVHLDECPTPDQVIRFFNLPVFEIDFLGAFARLQPAICREGYRFSEHHADALYAAEALGAVDGLRPLLQPISDRGLSPLMGELIADFYRHYPEPSVRYIAADGSTVDLAYSGVRRFEPTLIEIFDEDRMLPAIQELLAAVQGLELSGGEIPGEVIEDLMAHLLDPNAGVQGRNGESVHDRGDGQPTAMTRLYWVIDAVDALDASLDDAPEAREAWDRAAEELVDLLLEVEELADGTGRFVDRGSPALGSVMAAHFARNLRRHLDSGDLFRRLREDYPDYVEELLTSRGLAAVVEMLRSVRQSPADQALFDELLVYLTEESELTTRSGLALIYELLLGTTDSIGYVEVAPFYAGLVDPDRRFDVVATDALPILTHGALVLRAMLDADPDDVGIELLRRGLVTPEGRDEAPLSVLARVIRQVHRLEPGAQGLMTAADWANLYRTLGEFIRDDLYGIERAFLHMQARQGDRP